MALNCHPRFGWASYLVFPAGSGNLECATRQAENGVKIYILFSEQTRAALVDVANYISGHKLAKAGVEVLRYTHHYMHAKSIWNNRGDIIFGSANMDVKSLSSNFECCLRLRHEGLAGELHQVFEVDRRQCWLQTSQTLHQRSWSGLAASYLCLSLGAWL